MIEYSKVMGAVGIVFTVLGSLAGLAGLFFLVYIFVLRRTCDNSLMIFLQKRMVDTRIVVETVGVGY